MINRVTLIKVSMNNRLSNMRCRRTRRHTWHQFQENIDWQRRWQGLFCSYPWIKDTEMNYYKDKSFISVSFDFFTPFIDNNAAHVFIQNLISDTIMEWYLTS